MNPTLKPFRRLALLILVAFAERGGEHERGITARSRLELDWYNENDDGSFNVSFLYPNWARPRVEFWNVKPKSLDGLKLSDPIPIKTEQQDALSAVLENLDGNKAIKETYNATYTKTTSLQDSFTHGFKQSIEQTFGYSYGALSGETKVGFEASQQWEKVKTEEESVSKSLSREYECDPGIKLEVWADRSAQKLKRIATGHGSYEFSVIRNGAKLKHGRKFESLDQLIRVFEGRSPDNFPWAKWFRGRPTRSELIDRMKSACQSDFTHEMIYDNVAKSVFHSKVISTNKDNPYYVDPKAEDDGELDSDERTD